MSKTPKLHRKKILRIYPSTFYKMSHKKNEENVTLTTFPLRDSFIRNMAHEIFPSGLQKFSL